jgi:glycosyltransferase involved in cell wall biosynthesis
VGRPAGTISVQHLGLEEGWRSPELTTLPRPRAGPYIVYVGNVKPHKNLKGLLAAFDRIRHRVPHDLVLIGRVDGFLTGDNEVADRLGRKDSRVVLAGPLSDTEVKTYVAHAEMLVLPSFYEGFGLPPIEAMACGCPAAVARAASMPEICGDAACYFSPHDSDEMARVLLEVLTSAELAVTLRQKGLQQSARYRWNESAVRVRRVISGLLSAPTPREKGGVP